MKSVKKRLKAPQKAIRASIAAIAADKVRVGDSSESAPLELESARSTALSLSEP